MAYCTVDDLKKKITEATLIQLTDTTGGGVIDIPTAQGAIQDADAVINAHASVVYQTPFEPPPMLIADLSSTIAIAHLHRYRSIEEPVWNRAYESAIVILEKIAAGSVTLEGVVKEPTSSGNSAASFDVADRRFSRDSLKGM